MAKLKKEQIPWNKKEFSKEKVEEIANLYNKNIAFGEIGKLNNVSGEVIKRILISNGIKLRTRKESYDLRKGKEPCNKIKIPTEIKKQIILLYGEKKSRLQIAKILGYSEYIIKRVLKENGIKIRRRTDNRRDKFNLNEKKIVEDYKNGISSPKLCREYNCCAETIIKVLKENGVEIKKPYDYPTPTKGLTKENSYFGRLTSERMKNNNPMKNKETLEKMRRTKLKQYQNGFKVWNDGLTKETDERLKKLSENTKISSKERWKDPIEAEKMSAPRRKLSEKEKEPILKLFDDKYNCIEIGKIFNVCPGTVARYLKLWGRKLNKVGYGTICKSEDGHTLRSCREMLVDNWLYSYRITHENEKHIGKTNFRCDFFIPGTGTWIEVIGLKTKRYLEFFERKLKIYEELGLINNLVIISPKDKIGDKLGFLLKISKVQKNMNNYKDAK